MDIVVNKKARFEYEITDTYEAGIVLIGSEVKSIRNKKISLADSYAVFKKDELYLINARVEPYSHSAHFTKSPTRARKLLLHKKELQKLKGKIKEKGWTLIPLKIYIKDKAHVKVLLGLGRGKKTYDKKMSIKEKDLQKDALRELKNFRMR